MKYTERQLYNMENSRLRELYKKIKTRNGRFAKFPVFLSIPAILFFLLLGWQFLLNLHKNSLEIFFDCSVTGFIEFVIFAICGIMLTSTDNRFIVSVPVIFCVLIGLKFLLFRTYSAITILMLVYLIVACVVIYGDNKVRNVLMGMNLFPFNSKSDGKKPKREEVIDYDEILKKFN